MADPSQPLPTANRHPLTGLLGLPEATGAALVPPGGQMLRLSWEIGSVSIYDLPAGSGDATAILDGETQRFTLSWRQRLSEHWEGSVVLPVIRHDGGFLDPIIEGWHDAFGLPNGDRDLAPRGLLRYRYAFGGESVDVTDGSTGAGDLRLGLARRISERLSLRAQLKLPTGDAADLTGSGGTDVSASAHYSSGVSERGFYTHLSLGMHAGDDGDLLPEAREPLVGFGSVTVGWRVRPRWHLKLQIDGQTAAFDSPATAIGEPSLQLSAGVATRLSDAWTVELGFSEDIAVERSPDIVFLASLRWHPGT